MPILIPLWPLLAGALVLMLAATWPVTIGPLLRGIAHAIDSVNVGVGRVTLVSFHGVANAIRHFEANLHRSIGEAVEHMAHPLSIAFHGIGRAFGYPAQQLAGLAQDVAHTLAQLRRVVIPAMIAAHVAWIPRRLAALAAEVAHLPHSITSTSVRVVTKTVTHVERIVVHKAVSVTLPRLGRIEREANDAWKAVTRLGKVTLPGVLVAPVVFALGRTGLGWLRCSKVKRYGKQVCGMDESLLDSLVADTLLIVGTISLVEFAEGLGAGMSEFAPQIRRFWQV